uniref:Superoxide dismutase n=1 Tax=Hemiselmis tepida TaxID=464990 RepID=A0A7S0VVA7_9CRYP|mmetsp:Transcript_29585/g.74958  ORF Transcript_29585/g.74958 Transcript_29585/m.74958 type:complete len:241 (+) Transcript_29585:35-757(+)
MLKTAAAVAVAGACVAQAFMPSAGFSGARPSLRQAAKADIAMKIELAPLPYDYTALEPKIGKQTLTIHHDKHHAKYVNVANQMIEGTDMEGDDCATIVMKAHKESNQGLFNNAAQAWNHDFYWQCMKPGGGGEPTGELMDQIKKDFGSFDEFKKQFDVAGNTAFGSGWAWLSWDGKKLVVDKTIGAGNPITEGKTPILTMDVWEHAYYLDYQNMRATYATDFIESLVNWDFVAKNLAAAK